MPALPVNIDLAALRRNYALEALSENEVLSDPFRQFEAWMQEALHAQLLEPNAMVLATADASGQPSARTVLLKGIDAEGFVFYTNYDSRKGRDIAVNPKAALLFNWLELERQVRIEGLIEKISPELSLQYFQSRPTGSQIGAWASPQSAVIESREALEQRFAEAEARFYGAESIPLPSNWGGYRLKPAAIEFWQGRENRLHDRIVFSRSEEGWSVSRLAP